jgi:repressor LexA
MNLTRRQQEIYDYLTENQEFFDHPPTLDELCQALDLTSRGSLHREQSESSRAEWASARDTPRS